jgi:polysaccharide biosynthesis protein PslH
MRILFIAPRLPHRGVLSGHQIVYQRMRRLRARGHELGLACYSRPGEETAAEEWSGGLLDLEQVPDPALSLRRRGAPDRMPSMPSEFLRRVGDMVERSRYHAAIAEFTEMGRALHHNPFLPAVRRVISVHQGLTAAAEKRAELLGYTPAGIRARLVRDRRRRMETALYRGADRVLVLTPQDRYALQQLDPGLHMALAPAGVDTEYFHPPEIPVAPKGILFTGYYSHEPNCDAVRWFASQVWPQVRALHPELLFYVVGAHPPPDILNLGWKDASIVVTGQVEDVRPYLAQSAIFVCPVRMGSGMRMKILEAMACAVPVVTTSLGAEGLPLVPGRNGFVADQADIMARQIHLLLSDLPLRAAFGRHGRATVVERHSWDRGVRRLERLLEELIERPKTPAAPAR